MEEVEPHTLSQRADTLECPWVLDPKARNKTCRIYSVKKQKIFFVNLEEGKLYCFATSFSYYIFVWVCWDL